MGGRADGPMLRVSAKRVSARAAQIGSQLDNLQVLTENEDAARGFMTGIVASPDHLKQTFQNYG